MPEPGHRTTYKIKRKRTNHQHQERKGGFNEIWDKKMENQKGDGGPSKAWHYVPNEDEGIHAGNKAVNEIPVGMEPWTQQWTGSQTCAFGPAFTGKLHYMEAGYSKIGFGEVYSTDTT